MSELDVCLGISGSFEGGSGGPRWDLLTGNFDKMGISVGCLQWNPGTGSLQKLLSVIVANFGGALPDAYSVIAPMVTMDTKRATRYAVDHFIEASNPTQPVTPDAKELWSSLLRTPESLAAQASLAQVLLDRAVTQARQFLPFLSEIDLRTQAFFFDLWVQQGGITKKIDGKLWAPAIIQDPASATGNRAAAYATQMKRTKTGAAWAKAAQVDPLANVLLHYALERASVARPEYVWDALSRRGTIAARQGQVHGKWFDFQNTLP